MPPENKRKHDKKRVHKKELKVRGVGGPNTNIVDIGWEFETDELGECFGHCYLVDLPLKQRQHIEEMYQALSSQLTNPSRVTAANFYALADLIKALADYHVQEGLLDAA